MSRNCLDCGEALSGRRDKKFCDYHCRNNYHNRQQEDLSAIKRKVHRLLQRNHRILTAFQARGIDYISHRELLMAGFDFRFCTAVESAGSGPARYCLYDLAYYRVASGQYALQQMRETA